MARLGSPSKLEKRVKRVEGLVLRSGAASGLAALRARAAGHAPRTMLIISDGAAYTSEEQFAPMLRHSRAIAARYGLVLRFARLAAMRGLTPAALEGVHAVGLKLTWRTPREEAERISREVFGAARAAGARALAFDGDDHVCVLWPGMIEACDAYIKKHVLADRDAYKQPFVGHSNLTDYVHRHFGVSFETNVIQSIDALTDAQADKIVLGWNIALDDKMIALARQITPAMLAAPREVDITCRALVGPERWTYGIRNPALEAIAALAERYRVYSAGHRVPEATYYQEMLRARVTVSPFGFGELCWRDFESILCGGLMVKQNMSHVRTWPDLFVPGETYVPVAWDFSDFARACVPYLDDEAARRRVADAARARLLELMSRDAFVDRFGVVMRAAGVLARDL